MNWAIELEALTKRFGQVLALDRLTFKVQEGDITGFIGPNGSGKTTTMRVLATLLSPDSGSAKVFGQLTHDAASASRVRARIGFVPDYFGLYNDMTPTEYLDFFGAAYRIPSKKRPGLVKDILALLNLSAKGDTLIQGLSRGMQQKLSLGRALIHSPDLLILDEPASGLDPRARIELMELLRELKTMGKTLFVSSHILGELHNLCDQVVILEKGRAVYTGGLEEASEGLWGGRRVLQIRPADPTQAVEETIRQLPGVISVVKRKDSFLIEYETSVRSPDLIEGCVKSGIRLMEAKLATPHLEEIFMRLTEAEE